MDGTRLLLTAVFVVAAIMAISAAITAMAPYLAILIVLGGVFIWVGTKEDPGE